jgi:thiamine-monophosphate kinase
MSEEKKLREISDLGEFGLIDHLTRDFTPRNPSTVKGVGDDAAVLDFKDKQVVVTTDILMEGIHFDLMYTPLVHLGYKAIVVNLSDVYAMNARPTQVIVSIAMSSKLSLEAVESIYQGIRHACQEYEVDLVGGDTSASLTGLAISITALGEANPDELVYRSGAKANDLLCVSGTLGGAFAGLQLLEREKKIFLETKGAQPLLDQYELVLQKQLRPEARRDIINLLKSWEVKPTAMIDVSDGLSSEILHICKSSAKGCRLYIEKIPIAGSTREAAAEMGIEPLICALNGGEDYELLFTVSLEDHDKVKAIPGISVIGHITNDPSDCLMVLSDGSVSPVVAQGWNAYPSK